MLDNIIHPLGITCEPISGESLMSLIARHCEANFIARPTDLLAAAWIEVLVPGFIPFTKSNDAAAMAGLFGVAFDEVAVRMHGTRDVAGGADCVNYFGTPLERRHFDDRRRRVAPGALAQHGFHRPAWSLRAFDFCPWSFERLQADCRRCGHALGWGRSYGLGKCDRCEASLLDVEVDQVKEEDRDALRVLSRLLSTDPVERAAAIVELPPPFNTWDLNAVIDAICELGAVATRSPRDALTINKALRGSLEFLDSPTIAAGLGFMNAFDEHLLAYVAKCYQEIGSTSVHKGFGVLSRHFSQGVKHRPLTALVKERLPVALLEAHVPVKRRSERYREAEGSVAVMTMVEARHAAGVAQRILARLEGRSPTFLSRSADRGGTALFAAERIRALRSALDEAVTASEAAQALGLPIYIIPQLVADGLLEGAGNDDVDVLYGVAQRISRQSLESLSVRLAASSVDAFDHGIALAQGLPSRIDPRSWSTAIQHLLDGRAQRADSGGCDVLPLADLRIRKRDAALLSEQLFDRPLMGRASCRDAALALGTSGQFVAAAVSAGLVEGETKKGGAGLSLDSLKQFHARYILACEIAARLECRLHQVRSRLDLENLVPAHTVYRVRVWERSDVEGFLLAHESV